MTTSRLTLAAPAVRPALKARLMLAAPSGAGKTKTALIISTVLAEDEHGKVIVIDTEKESALTYADDFDFIHLPWRPPYDPRELATTITEAGREHAVVVVDSTSHFWRKKGGTLDIAGGKFTGWADARPAQEDLVDAILGCNAHVILCARSKQEHVQEQDERGRHVVKKLGMAPQQDDDLEYEMNISCEMDMKHEIAVSKSRCDAVPVGRSFGAGHAGELAELYRDWLKVGEPPAPQAAVDALVARMNALPPEARKACKGEFVAELGRPELLREARLDAAEALVARFENGGGGSDEPPVGSPAAPPSPAPVSGGGGAADLPPHAPAPGVSQADEGTPAGVPSEDHTSPGPAPSSAATFEPGGEPAAVDRDAHAESADEAAPSGPVTADTLLAAAATIPGRDTPAKQRNSVMKTAAVLAGRAGVDAPGDLDTLAATPDLAAAVLADLHTQATPVPPERAEKLRTQALAAQRIWGAQADERRRTLIGLMFGHRAGPDGEPLSSAKDLDGDELDDLCDQLRRIEDGRDELWLRGTGEWCVRVSPGAGAGSAA